MTTTLIIAMATTGVSLAGLMIGLVAWLRADIRRMEDHIERRLLEFARRLLEFERRLSALEHSQAKLEGLLEGLCEAVALRAVV